MYKCIMHIHFFVDLNLKILRDDSACPGACQVIQWYSHFIGQAYLSLSLT